MMSQDTLAEICIASAEAGCAEVFAKDLKEEYRAVVDYKVAFFNTVSAQCQVRPARCPDGLPVAVVAPISVSHQNNTSSCAALGPNVNSATDTRQPEM
jgi:hypothetical protein